MSSMSLIDSVIDDDDEFCPLCIEEFDLSDKNFKPCPCGYQICQFCYNNIKTQNEEGRCPNCRRGYDESTIQYKIPDVEEFKADLALKHRKAAAAKKKEAERREIEASSRKNLAGVRVVQKNLVYVIGLNPTIRDENQLLQTLRGREYFGQYGEIEKIVVSKAKPGGNPNQGIGVYVTFSRKSDAATCIGAVDGSGNGDRVLRAQYGTTKYCSSFLRNEQCNNRNCTFLHETGEDSDSYSRQDLSSMNTISTPRQSHPSTPSHPRPLQPSAYSMLRQPSKDESISSRSGVPDGPALPSSASWANKDVAIHRTRRASLTGSQASNSPRPANVNVAIPAEEPKRLDRPSPISQEAQQTPPQPKPQSPSVSSLPRRTTKAKKEPSPFEDLLKDINSPSFIFSFSTADLGAEEIKLISNYPSFIDPYGGVKRRAMREKVEQERLSREHELLQNVAAEEDSREAGSLQLGGEPEDANPTRGRQSRESHGAIQPPSQQDTAENSAVGSPVSATSHQFQGLNLAGRSLTPLQQQQLMLLKSAGNQQAGLSDGSSSAALDQPAQVPQGLLHNQMAQIDALQAAQSRQPSRFSFNEAGSKNMANARILGQLQSGSPNPLSAPSPQHSLAGSFYASGVQGPPPGLKAAGTPPISGGGMFAQGHGFTSGIGGNGGKQDATPELMRELLRGRTGTNFGGNGRLQGQDSAKLGEDFPSLGDQPNDSRPVDSFGFLKSQLPTESAARASTPNLPPGLPLPKAHASSSVFQDQTNASKPASPAPFPPPGLTSNISWLGSPPQKGESSQSRPLTPELTVGGPLTSSRVKNAFEISLGSPVQKPLTKARNQQNAELNTIGNPKSSKSKPSNQSLPNSSAAKGSPLDFSAALVSSGKSERVSVPASASATESRPDTPQTIASRLSESPAPRQPRILRVVETPKIETSSLATAPSAPVSAAGGAKTRSRRQSVSSISIPETPADVGSEADFYASASASRANSPPASSRIGSAPVRSMTKSQVKKERKQKAKEAEARKVEAAPVSEEPVQAPIMGRKRKTKKAPAPTPQPNLLSVASKKAEPIAATVREPEKPVQSDPVSPVKTGPKVNTPETPKEKEPEPAEEPTASVEQESPKEQPEEAWRSNNTLGQLIADAETSGKSIQDLFAERTTALQVLLAKMHNAGEIDLNTCGLFNPSSINQRTDVKCTAADYDLLKHPTELTENDRKALLRGEPVRIGDSLKNRVLITPRGCILRHLSVGDEELMLTHERNGNIPSFKVGEDDLSNNYGGLDALFANPEKFNICWVDDVSTPLGDTFSTSTLAAAESVIPPNVLSAMEADSTRNHDWAVANSAELLNTTPAAVRSFAAATAQQMLGNPGVVNFNPTLEDLSGMTSDELTSFSTGAQKNLEKTRKEMDALDKKFAAFVRRNKKLKDTALNLAAESVK